MAKRFAYYYLQVNFGHAWETLEQSESVAVLNAGLADQLASPTDAEIRLVGANFDTQSARWDYEQLFYIDQSSVDLGISDEPEFEGPESSRAESLDHHPIGRVDQSSTPRIDPVTDHGDMDDGAPGPAITALMREREEINTPEDTPAPSQEEVAPDDEEAAPPWLSEPSTAPDDDSAPPRRRVSVGKIIGIVFVFLFLALWVAIGALLYLQNPVLLDAADKLGIGDYLRLSTSDPEAVTGETKMETNSDAMPLVEPLTTGQVVRYVGVAPALRGRWSPRKCDTTYIEFDENSYNRSIDGQGAAEQTEISETLEDDFVFYLRRSAEMVEHYRKVTANDIQLAGASTENGFLGNSEKVEIYSRCP
jgi:hypothetical protein